MAAKPKYFLTIGIPTWNRCRYLERLLDLLTAEIKSGRLSKVEILVSDNASDDGTLELMQKKYLGKYPFLNYSRNPINLKVKGNILNLAAQSQGQYLWFMGDDDQILPDKLAEVVNLLSPTANKIYLFNTINAQGGLKLYSGLQPGDYEFAIGSSLLSEHLPSMGLLSNLILPVKETKAVISPELQLTPIWPHLHLALLVAGKNNFSFHLHNQVVTDNNNKNLVYRDLDNLRVFVEGYFEMVSILEQQLGKDFKQLKYSSLEPLRFVSNYISSTFTGEYFKDLNYIWKLNKKMRNWKLKLLSLPFFIPKPLRQALFYLACLGSNNLSKYYYYRQEYALLKTNDGSDKSTRGIHTNGNIF